MFADNNIHAEHCNMAVCNAGGAMQVMQRKTPSVTIGRHERIDNRNEFYVA